MRASLSVHVALLALSLSSAAYAQRGPDFIEEAEYVTRADNFSDGSTRDITYPQFRSAFVPASARINSFVASLADGVRCEVSSPSRNERHYVLSTRVTLVSADLVSFQFYHDKRCSNVRQSFTESYVFNAKTGRRVMLSEEISDYQLVMENLNTAFRVRAKKVLDRMTGCEGVASGISIKSFVLYSGYQIVLLSDLRDERFHCNVELNLSNGELENWLKPSSVLRSEF